MTFTEGQSVLSHLQQQELSEFMKNKTEHHLIAKLTPILVEICHVVGFNFVNSEEYKWIKTLLERAINMLKPDGFSTIPNLYFEAAATRVTELKTIREETSTKYLFGYGIWELRDYYIVWKFKINIAPADRGTAYSYIINLSRNDKYNIYYVILCDVTTFYIISGRDGRILESKFCYYESIGSQIYLSNILSYRNKSLELLIQTCQLLHLTVMKYLGSGRFGRCFEVQNQSQIIETIETIETNERIETNDTNKPNERMVLKTVLTFNNPKIHKDIYSRVKQEYEKIKIMNENKIPHIVTVIPNSFRIIMFEGNILGAAYLMKEVGIPLTVELCQKQKLLPQLISSLQIIHKTGQYHGDARINNAILYNNEIIWVDLFYGISEIIGLDPSYLRLDDINHLLDSVDNSYIKIFDLQIQIYQQTLNCDELIRAVQTVI